MWAVDRDKSLDSDLTDQREIFSVSTFIFYRNDVEIGRIIERPDYDYIEIDILNIYIKLTRRINNASAVSALIFFQFFILFVSS